MWHVKMYVLSPRLCAFTAVFMGIYYGFSMEFPLLCNVFFLRIFHGFSMIFHGFSVYFAWLFCGVSMVLQIHIILFQCLMILPSCIPCYTMIRITSLILFIPLILTPGSLFYSLFYLVYCLTPSPPTSAQDTY